MNRKTLACSAAAILLSAGAAFAAKAPTTYTVNGGGSSLAYPLYTTDMAQYTAGKSKDLFSYEAVGSGAGQNAFLNNNIGYFEPVSPTNTIGYAAGTLTYGTIVGTQVDFGASDAFLSASQLTNPATGSYSQSAADGPLIQIPTVGVPITIPYNENGIDLILTDSQTCGVFSGKITDWHTFDPDIPSGTPITVIYRSDGSGTSFLLTQHLAAVCNSGNSNVTFTASKTFASEFGGTPPSNFIGESGSGNVAKELLATTGSIGYVSPDYTSIAPNSPNTTSLVVASLVNATNGVAYPPTVQNTTLGLANPGPTSTNGTPPASLSAAQDPLNWVPAIPTTLKGYPIVGYTTVDASTCYSVADRGKLVIDILETFLKKSGAYATNTTNDGFVPLANSGAAKFYTAVDDTFFTNKSGYNLNIDGSACAGLPGR